MTTYRFSIDNIRRYWVLIVSIFFLVFSLGTATTQAADIILAWDANTESSLSGYYLYYKTGDSGEPYDGNEADQGSAPIQIPLADLADASNPQFTLSGLSEATGYYFTVTAYSNEEEESGYSNEVYFETGSTPTPPTYTITADAGDNGTIYPNGAVTVTSGDDQSFTISADSGYHIGDVEIDGSSVGPVDVFAFDNVSADHTISATFEINTYSITASAGANGSISPAGTLQVNHGGSQTYTITPANGHHVSDVLVDGDSVGPVGSYTFNQVVCGHTIEAVFAVNSYSITASADANGSILPAETVSVDHGSTQTFTITPASGYHVSDVLVDGVSIGPASSYTFDNIVANHTIEASFAANTYTITASAAANGSISPSGGVSVIQGQNRTFSITPNAGYRVSDVIVDNNSVGLVESYTFSNVSATHTIHASFEAANQGPLADAGPDQNLDEGLSVTLSGLNSIDPDGQIVSMEWLQIEGPTVALNHVETGVVSFTTPDVGVDGESLIFELTVTDDVGSSATDTCIVNVLWVNLPPHAEAGSDQVTDEGVMVTLDGTNSTDPDQTPLAYEWRQSAGIPVSLSDKNASQPTFTAPDVDADGESLQFELTVTDSGGLKDTDQVIVTVSWINQPPIANAGPDQNVTEGEVVTLSGTNSDDGDDGIAAYHWSQIQGPPVELSDATSVEPSFTAPNSGQEGTMLQFSLTVTDKGGLKHQDDCMINVTWENEPPMADAGPDQEVREGSLVSLDGSGSQDNDDGIQLYQWSQVEGPVVTLSDAGSVAPTFTAPDVGPEGASLRFSLVVSDYNGLQSTDTCIVNITWQNQPPIANAGGDQDVSPGDLVTLSGAASSDPDDGIAHYAWTQISGPPVTLSDPTTVSTAFIAPAANSTATLTFTLKVTDKGGLAHEDSCVITVQPIMQVSPPVVTIKSPVTDTDGSYSTENSTISLSGTADSDIGIERVLWFTSLDESGVKGESGVAVGRAKWTIENLPLPLGSTTITIIAEDINGQQGVTELNVTRSLADNQAPDLEITSPDYNGHFIFTTRKKISFTGTSSDDTGVEKVTWKSSRRHSGIASGTTTWSIKNIPLRKWWNSITITAEDAAGNKTEKSLLVFYWRW
jgi:hypothetical protein